ncbi:MAG: DNA-directed RNA polymerase subunit alpha [Thermodesulfovibrionales bacterium]|nr:DNA-directed RNA polymerase subunit alpha [Thermodesulfovibrionales bacterium]
MDLNKKGFQMPLNRKITIDEKTHTDRYGKIIVEPLERGFGITIGNSLRRILLSSIEGTAVYAVSIKGCEHELSSIRGVKEDVIHIILNLKKLRFFMQGYETKRLTINVKGHKVVTGADIATNGSVEVLNRDQYIATVDVDASLEMEIFVKKGRGYVPAEQFEDENLPVGTIAIDAVFSPISKVNYVVEKTRVGKSTDYDRLVLEVWTDGSITPEKAVSDAATIMMDHLDMFIVFDEDETEEDEKKTVTLVESDNINANLSKHIDEIELSVRAYNCLKNANIKTIADLVQKTEHEMLRTKNFGRKSLNEIKQVLNSMGLRFGMRLPQD